MGDDPDFTLLTKAEKRMFTLNIFGSGSFPRGGGEGEGGRDILRYCGKESSNLSYLDRMFSKGILFKSVRVIKW